MLLLIGTDNLFIRNGNGRAFSLRNKNECPASRAWVVEKLFFLSKGQIEKKEKQIFKGWLPQLDHGKI